MAPNEQGAHSMRAWVLSGGYCACEAGPRSAAEFNEAAAHWDRAAALSDAPAVKAEHAGNAANSRRLAEAM